ncbi:MAG: hypothetical protein ACR2FH_08050 [Caulobacteraceae bacterium]
MIMAALAIGSFFYAPHHGPAQVTQRLYGVGAWRIGVYHDTFTGAVSCSLRTNRIHYRSETLIFRLGRGVETTHAVFRLDGGTPRPVAEAFHIDEARGFFPRRGWIDDPAGGDVALPRTYFPKVKRLWIRASPASQPQFFNVSRFAEALAGARAAGCAETAFGDTTPRWLGAESPRS